VRFGHAPARLLQVNIRGRPSHVEFEDFDGKVNRTPGFPSEGLISPWNSQACIEASISTGRSTISRRVPTPLGSCPTGSMKAGSTTPSPLPLPLPRPADSLSASALAFCSIPQAGSWRRFLSDLTPARYDEFKRASCAAPRHAFIADHRDCARLLEVLGSKPSIGIRRHRLDAAERHGSFNRVGFPKSRRDAQRRRNAMLRVLKNDSWTAYWANTPPRQARRPRL